MGATVPFQRSSRRGATAPSPTVANVGLAARAVCASAGPADEAGSTNSTSALRSCAGVGRDSTAIGS